MQFLVSWASDRPQTLPPTHPKKNIPWVHPKNTYPVVIVPFDVARREANQNFIDAVAKAEGERAKALKSN